MVLLGHKVVMMMSVSAIIIGIIYVELKTLYVSTMSFTVHAYRGAYAMARGLQCPLKKQYYNRYTKVKCVHVRSSVYSINGVVVISR